jgi:vitamin B12 transporter
LMSTLLLLALLGLQVSSAARVSGVVTDATGLPLPGASVELNGQLVAMSDHRGAFDLAVTPGISSRLQVTLDGFEPFETLLSPDVSHLTIALAVRRFEDRVNVTARLPGPPVDPVFTRQPIDVYRTPGAQGDLLRALQTLPGVAAPDDAAGLFVRGGDVSEVLVSLDDAVIAHPYRYESPTGGFRGAVDPMLLSGLAFSTGGFSARHGNALSAVLELHGLDRPELPEMSGTIGLAGASASIAMPVRDRVGVRAAANRTFTELLFAVNGTPRRFDPAPDGWDGSVGLGWDLAKAGRLKTFALVQRDSVGTEAEHDAFAGWLRASSRHSFAGARWDGAIGRWATAASLGYDGYGRQSVVGIVDLDVEDRTQSWRVDAARAGSPHVDWRAGGNGTFTRTTIDGRVPLTGGDLAGISGDSAFDVDTKDWYAGTYLEATTRLGIVTTTTGVRVDRFGRARATTVDPRLSLRVALGRTRAVRYATGIYHQAPASSYFDAVRGATRLTPMRAIHHVVGYEAGREAEGIYVRAEGYLKQYRDLPLENEVSGYASDGYGSARGLDLFGQWRSSRLDLRGMASWLSARRRWTPADQRNRYELPDGPWRPDFEIPWSVQAVATAPIDRGVSVAVSWRTAAGRPHTPVVGAIPAGGRYVPVFGAINSERMPRYERLDLAVNWLVPAGDGALMLFASLDNALGRANFFDYRYARDYSSREPAVSSAQRSIYAGATFRR